MKLRQFRGVLCVCLVAVFVSSSSSAAIGAIINLGATQDTRLHSYNTGLTDNSTLLSVYNIPGNTQRSLLQFDISSIPMGQQIDSAVLTLFSNTTYGSNPSANPMTVHQVTKSWVEAQATWNSASTGNTWTTPGGDHVATAIATSTLNPLSSNQPVTWNITSLVQDWYDGGASNHGLLIKAPAVTYLTFHSANFGTVAFRPNLQIIYSQAPVDASPVPEPSSLALFAVGSLASVVVSRRRNQSRHKRVRRAVTRISLNRRIR